VSSCSSPRQVPKKYVPVEEEHDSMMSQEEGQPMRVDPEESQSSVCCSVEIVKSTKMAAADDPHVEVLHFRKEKKPQLSSNKTSSVATSR